MSERVRVNKWMILVIAIIVVMLDFGLVFAFGAVFIEVLERFDETRSSVATLMSLFIGVTLSFGVVSGILITKLGVVAVTFIASLLVPLGFGSSFFAPNVAFLYVSIGIISGIGTSMMYTSCVVVVGGVFTGAQKHLCLTLINTGTGIASLGYPYILKWLLSLYCLHGTLLIIGGISCHSFAFFVLCFANSEEVKVKTNSESAASSSPDDRTICNSLIVGFRYIKALMNNSYLLLLIASTLSIASLNGFIGLIPDMSKWKGFTTAQGLLCYVFFGAFNTVSGLIPGILKQKKGMNSFMFLIVSASSGCIGQLILHFSTSYYVYLIGMSLSGITVGGSIASAVNVVNKLVKEEQVPVATGFYITMIILLSVAVGPIFGVMRDMSGAYTGVFMNVAASCFVAAILYTAALTIRRRQRNISEPIDDSITTTNNTDTVSM